VAAILRPNDVTDPDATNSDPAVPPTDPAFECANNGLGGICNNIRTLNVYYAVGEICTRPAAPTPVNVSGGIPATYTVASSTYGAYIDIYTLSSSFNAKVNGIDICHTGTAVSARVADGRVCRRVKIRNTYPGHKRDDRHC